MVLATDSTGYISYDHNHDGPYIDNIRKWLWKNSFETYTKIIICKVIFSYLYLYSLEIQRQSLHFTSSLNFQFCQSKAELHSAKRCYFKFNCPRHIATWQLIAKYIDWFFNLLYTLIISIDVNLTTIWWRHESLRKQ